ncbi:MAG: dihydrofolate reductase [Bacteroidales bacterium]|nr:dihydrofolate reductase [Bacteroidales bacterium]
MILSHIVAVSNNFVIGKNNSLPWRIPADLRYFHRITDGHIVLMGRKNYEANGGALQNRTNIIITRKKSFQPNDAFVANSVGAAIEKARSYAPDEVFIVGGGEIYAATLHLADRIYITVIDANVSGDTYYPEIRFSQYNTVSKIHKKADRENPFDHTYYILQRPNLKY